MVKTKNVLKVLKWKINPTFFSGVSQTGGRGGGSATWEFFPHNLVFFPDLVPNRDWTDWTFINCYPSPQHHDKRRRERRLLTRQFEITSGGRIRDALPANCIQCVSIIVNVKFLVSSSSSSFISIIILIIADIIVSHHCQNCHQPILIILNHHLMQRNNMTKNMGQSNALQMFCKNFSSE